MAGPPARELIERFAAAFPEADPRAAMAFRAPGRVNLIGEHTDYNQGFVLPIALPLACYAVSAPSQDGRFRVHSANLGETRLWQAADIPRLQPARHWTDYVIGVAQELIKLGFPPPALNLYLFSEVPVGSGLSSSASLEVASALAMLRGAPLDKLEIAKLCLRAENGFVGLPCGIMDQLISLCGVAHSAVKIDCRSLALEVVRLPDGVIPIAVNTMVKHELSGSEYRRRTEECQAAVTALARLFPGLGSLRDVTTEMLDAAAAAMEPIPLRRARHVVSENARVEAFVAAARLSDLVRLGELFVASHRSLQHDYEVSCEELDFLVDTALTLPGVYGARMTGGGFGGCTVSLVGADSTETFAASIRQAYAARWGIQPDVYLCEASSGAGPLPA